MLAICSCAFFLVVIVICGFFELDFLTAEGAEDAEEEKEGVRKGWGNSFGFSRKGKVYEY